LGKVKPKHISYNMIKAQLVQGELPFIDAEWIPSQNNRSGIVADSTHRLAIIKMMDLHAARHTLIPTIDGARMLPEAIHQECAKDMYQYCQQHDLRDAWAYLALEWYCKEPWINWARSAVADSIPLASTTMMIEAHWSRIKRVHLLHIPRPRLDQVLYVITENYCPQLLYKWQKALIERVSLLPYEKALLAEWNAIPEVIKKNGINPDRYFTDEATWVCSCPSFLQSRFLMCKHLFQVLRSRIT
jgi:hypothetical protein